MLNKVNKTTYQSIYESGKIVVGGEGEDYFFPEIDISVWGNEGSFKMNYGNKVYSSLGDIGEEVNKIILTVQEEYEPYEIGKNYQSGDLILYNNKFYEVVQSHTSQEDWPPDTTSALYIESTPQGVIAEWEQPEGSHDAYQIDTKVLYDDKVWVNTVDDNVWKPGEHGWEESAMPETLELYPLESTEQYEEGGFEFEVVLDEIPDSNVLIFDIETENLSFYYQDILTEEEIENQNVNRPENVMGSYAVYHSNNKDNEYKTGKVFHIYRPLIVDNAGNETWGELSIDTEIGILTVTIDQNWLDNAVYPVSVDPTFGFTSVGEEYLVIGGFNPNIIGAKYNLPDDSVDILSVTFNAWMSSSNIVKCGIYDADGMYVGETEEISGDDEQSWYTANISGNLVLDSGDYFLVLWVTDEDSLYYDAIETDVIYHTKTYDGDFPNDLSGDIMEDGLQGKISIYATYEIFSGGDGTEENPYKISTLDDLEYLSENTVYWEDYFELTNDIDASDTVNWNGGDGFIPIGNDTTAFTGHFDGKDYTIDGLYIDRPTEDYIGFIGVVDGTSNITEIKNLTLTNVDITGDGYIGALVGYKPSAGDDNVLIENCSISGSIEANGASVGGVLGDFPGDIADTKVLKCSFEGDIVNNYTSLNYTGGFVGDTYYVLYEECYTVCDITGNERVLGGFAGMMDSVEFRDCYARADITSVNNDGYIGGFGYSSSYQSDFYDCYAASIVPDGDNCNAFARLGVVNSCYFDEDLITFTDDGVGTPLTTSEMQDPSNFTGWDFIDTWMEDTGNTNDGYHILRAFVEIEEFEDLNIENINLVSLTDVYTSNLELLEIIQRGVISSEDLAHYTETLTISSSLSVDVIDEIPTEIPFNRKKELEVASVSGTPQVSLVVPIKITSGDDSDTGTGEIVLDWTNIASKADIAVYDENDDLLDYWFESFDASAETAVIHVYKAWTRDGSFQAQIVYGDGPEDKSVLADTVFDKNSELIAAYSLNETSGDALDNTSNDYDATVNGDTTQDQSGIVDGAYSFDGNGDYLDNTSIGSYLDGLSAISFSFWVKADATGHDRPIFACDTNSFGDGTDDFTLLRFDTGGWAGNGTEVLKAGIKSSTGSTAGETESYTTSTDWMKLVLTWTSGGTPKIYKDGVELSWSAAPSDLDGTLIADILAVGRGNKDGWWDGLIDAFRVYESALSADAIEAQYDAERASPVFFSQLAAEDIVGVEQYVEQLTVLSPINISLELTQTSAEVLAVNSIIRVELSVLVSSTESLSIIQFDDITFVDKMLFTTEIQIRGPTNVRVQDQLLSLESITVNSIFDVEVQSSLILDEFLKVLDLESVKLTDNLLLDELLNILNIQETSLVDNLVMLESLFVDSRLKVSLIDLSESFESLSIQSVNFVSVIDELKAALAEVLEVSAIQRVNLSDLAFFEDLLNTKSTNAVSLSFQLKMLESLDVIQKLKGFLSDNLTMLEILSIDSILRVFLVDLIELLESLSVQNINSVYLIDELKAILEEILEVSSIQTVDIDDLASFKEILSFENFNIVSLSFQLRMLEDLNVEQKLIGFLDDFLTMLELLDTALISRVNLIDTLKVLESLTVQNVNFVELFDEIKAALEEILEVSSIQTIAFTDFLSVLESLSVENINNVSITDFRMLFENLKAQSINRVSLSSQLKMLESLDIDSILEVTLEDILTSLVELNIQNINRVSVIDKFLAAFEEILDISSVQRVVLKDLLFGGEFLNVEDVKSVILEDALSVLEIITAVNIIRAQIIDTLSYQESLDILDIKTVDILDSIFAIDLLTARNINVLELLETLKAGEVLSVGNINLVTIFDKLAAVYAEILEVSNINQVSLETLYKAFDLINIKDVSKVSFSDLMQAVEGLNVQDITRVAIQDNYNTTELLNVEGLHRVSLTDLRILQELLQVEDLKSIDIISPVSLVDTLVVTDVLNVDFTTVMSMVETSNVTMHIKVTIDDIFITLRIDSDILLEARLDKDLDLIADINPDISLLAEKLESLNLEASTEIDIDLIAEILKSLNLEAQIGGDN